MSKKGELNIPEKITGIRRILRAFIFSRDGFIHMLKEDAFRQELLLTVVAGTALIFLDISIIMKLFMFVSLILILIVEILNTGMEALADMITLDFDLRVKAVKDMGSLAVLVSFIFAGIVWGVGIYLMLHNV